MALQLGLTLKELRRMSERELLVWQRFHSQKGFPNRRLELQLALLGLRVAQLMGNSDATLDDYTLDRIHRPEKPPTAEEHAMTLGDLSGRGVRKLGQGRKKK